MNVGSLNWGFISGTNFVLIIYLSFFLVPGSSDMPGIIIPHADKFGHFFLYGFQGLSLSFYLSKYNLKNKNTLVFFICLILGILIEYLQPVLTFNRVFDLFDILANISGVLTFFSILKFLK